MEEEGAKDHDCQVLLTITLRYPHVHECFHDVWTNFWYYRAADTAFIAFAAGR